MATGKTQGHKVPAKTAASGRKRALPAPSKGESRSTEKLAGAAAGAADEVDQQLARYRSMRDFTVTAEPSGADGAPASNGNARGKAARAVKNKAAATPETVAAPRPSARRSRASAGLPFVIQKHAASHLHYDFRLGWNGVLKSWAVAKGPSFYPGDRRLAVQVEDHPMEYGGFEGIIPQGQYGGGTVMVWDQGTWWPQLGHENVDAGLREGSLKFEMHGTKMQGKWTLVRMNARSTSSSGSRWGSSSKPNWLLIKEHDEFEHGPDDPPITEAFPDSAVTGRTMDEIAQHEDHVWNSKETAGTGQAWYRQNGNAQNVHGNAAAEQPSSKSRKATKEPSARVSTTSLSQFSKEQQPDFLSPQLAEEAETPPEGADWLHELKLDGYRIQARKARKDVKLLTRSGLDWTHRMPEIADAVRRLPAGSVTLDGEVVVLSPDGTTNFADLQAAFQNGAKNPLTYFCFDLLHVEGRNPRGAPLRERKALLSGLIPANDNFLRLSEHLETDGLAMFHKACELHAEGILSKRADAPYRAGRNTSWLKCKCLREQEFVVGGFTYSSDGDDRIGSLLLGYYRDGKLIYAGRTGTGFTQKSRAALRGQLEPLRLAKPAFVSVPALARRGAVWTRPALVAQVRFATWTADDLVRQAAFLGLREDKDPAEVRREEPTVAPSPKAARPSRLETSGAKPAPAGTAAQSTKPSASSSLPSSLRLTHPSKILDPESGLTKVELAHYYWAVAERMLPHIGARPLSLVRCPEGAGKPCFFQKHVNQMLPPGIGSVDVTDKKTGKPQPYITLDTREALAGLAQMGVLEVHPWGSRNDDLEHPDRLIFDLDPDESLPWSTLCEAAAEVRARLKKAGLVSFLKLTGGKGLHIVAPMEPEHDWAVIKDLAHRFVDSMARANPSLYLTKMTKAARTGRIYLDYLRNERGATAVAPYSPRARRGAHVSLPLPWSALKLPVRPVYSVHDFASWESQLKLDPWKAMLGTTQHLRPEAIAAG